MTTATEGSFDPRWRRMILRPDIDALRARLENLMAWSQSRLDLIDRALVGRDLTNPSRNDLVHLTERVTLIAVLSQLADDDDDDDDKETAR